MTSLLIQEPPLQVLPTLASIIGLNEAIFLQQLHYRLLHATREKEGRKWVFDTAEDWQKDHFPFWSVPTVRRVAASLEEKRLIITSSRWNRMPIDKTKWYTIDYAVVERLTSDQVDQSHDLSKRSIESDQVDHMERSFWSIESDQVDHTNNQENKNHKQESTQENGFSPSQKAVWRDAYTNLQLRLPAETFDAWLKDAQLLAVDGDTYVIGVVSEPARAWLEGRLGETVHKAFERAAGKVVEVRYEVI